MRGDGNGFVENPDGTKHWGLHGAAGLLLRAPAPDGTALILLQHRALWTHDGGTWSLPGGARDSHETAAEAAVREALEEAGIAAEAIRVRGEQVTAVAPSGWTYTTVVADVVEALPVTPNNESVEIAWIPEGEVELRPLHPAFALVWPELRIGYRDEA
ncbi:NUDIX domain-containing protein [Nocardia stercoris]|uniref:NUDIX domain-containing protein n=2 Tax=Nocardia stercoris TaxID=2483361 RepID=A0A3M2KYN7_9NOCA|nr:NUDIX domain-containing protein [Nocardia stercoris]